MSPAARRCVMIRVSGRVQGVFFRASTKNEADRLGISGIVRNEPDASVYIEAEGSDETINKFVAWCKQGPPQAKVSNFDMKEVQPKGFVGFQIVR